MKSLKMIAGCLAAALLLCSCTTVTETKQTHTKTKKVVSERIVVE